MQEWNTWLRSGAEWALLSTGLLSTAYFCLTLIVLFLRRFRPCPVPEKAAGAWPRVTIQIPTYNERAALACAARCLDMEYPEDRLQILIGDDSNRKEVSDEIDAFAARYPRVTVCRRGNNAGFKPGNLNHMLRQTVGDYILVLDSDFLPERDFLRRLVQPVMRDPGLAGVQAGWRVVNVHQNLTTLMGAGIVYLIHVVILPFLQRFARTGVFCGSAELVRKDLLVDCGGWTPGALTEDVDYSLRAFTRGRRIAYLEDLGCACEVPHTPRDLFRQQMRWAYGVLRAFMDRGPKLMVSHNLHLRAKLAALCFGSGYLMVFLMLLSFGLGLARFAGDALVSPDPVLTTAGVESTPLRMIQTVVLTCGMLLSSLCASFMAGVSVRHIGKLVVASLTLGIVLLFFIGKGLFNAFFGLSMPWFMVRKNGNAVRAV